MKYFVISHFKYGLDTRKSELASVPGTLLTCQNAYIDPGGKVVKRKAFVPLLTAVLPSTCFGLEYTDQGLTTFGSHETSGSYTITQVARGSNGIATVTVSGATTLYIGCTITISGTTTDSGHFNGTWVITGGNDPTWSFQTQYLSAIGTTADSGTLAYTNGGADLAIIYQRLQPPPTSVTKLTNMSAVLFSACYKGKAFVIATFTGSTRGICFYNGTAVNDSFDGLPGIIKTTGTLVNNMATALAAEVVADLPDWSASASTNTVTINSPVGISFTPTPVENSVSGSLGVALLATSSAGTPGRAASIAFVITGTPGGTAAMTAPANSDGTGTADLIGGTLTLPTSTIDAVVTFLVAAVNANTYLTGYTAGADLTNDKVNIFAPVAWGALANNFTVSLTLSTMTGASGATSQVAVSITPASIEVNLVRTGSTAILRSATATITGGSGTVTYSWAECNADGSTPVSPASGMTLSGAATATASFGKVLAVNTDCQAYFKVTATDSVLGATTAVISVYYSVTNLA